MFYEFPIIRTIEDVLPAIAGSPEFIVAEKDGYKVINYMVNMEDTFPPIDMPFATIRRECRGIKFDSVTGKTIARPYHKFFNVGEREEVRLDKIDLEQPHFRLFKLDGSMVHPMMVNGVVRWATKMGITDTSMQAEEFVARNPDYQDMAEHYINEGFTPIFEWCSNKNRIVLNYPEDQLVLTAIRHTVNGQYYHYISLDHVGKMWDIPVVDESESTIDEIAKLENTEGIVIRFDDGHMLKMKCEWYVLRHKSKDAIMREKNVLEYIVTDKVDDIVPFLIEADAIKLRDFQHEVEMAIVGLATKLEFQFVDLNAAANGSRREFAALNNGIYKNFMFKMLDGHSVYDMIKKHIATKCGTQSGVDSIRHLITGLEWKY